MFYFSFSYGPQPFSCSFKAPDRPTSIKVEMAIFYLHYHISYINYTDNIVHGEGSLQPVSFALNELACDFMLSQNLSCKDLLRFLPANFSLLLILVNGRHLEL